MLMTCCRNCATIFRKWTINWDFRRVFCQIWFAKCPETSETEWIVHCSLHSIISFASSFTSSSIWKMPSSLFRTASRFASLGRRFFGRSTTRRGHFSDCLPGNPLSCQVCKNTLKCLERFKNLWSSGNTLISGSYLGFPAIPTKFNQNIGEK